MRENVLPFRASINHDNAINKNSERRRIMWAAACAVSTMLGFSCAIGGFFLSVASRFESGADVLRTSRAGSFLLLASLFIFFFAAHALDRVAFYRDAAKKKRSNSMRLLLILFFMTCAAVNFAAAQQTIFNVPSTDVLEKGKVYGEIDAAFRPNNDEQVKRFSSFTPRIVVGIGGKTEIGLSVTGNTQPSADATTLVPTIKWKFYERNKTALIAGTNFYVPVRRRTYKFGAYSYLAGSQTLSKTRLTAGAYLASKNVFAAKASRAGGQFAVEQTVNDKFTVAADWITGRHANGYFTPGIVYKPRPPITAYLAYSIGNGGVRKGNHFFLFELGYNFN